jgi:hypothetical protein
VRAEYIRRVGHRYQARPKKRDGRGRVNLGTFDTRAAAEWAITRYYRGTLNPLPRYVVPAGPAGGYRVIIRHPGLYFELPAPRSGKPPFDSPEAAERAARQLIVDLYGVFSPYFTEEKW